MSRLLIINNIDIFQEQSRREWVEQWSHDGHELFVISPSDSETVAAANWPVEWIDWSLCQHGMNPMVEIKSVFALIRAVRCVRPDIVLNLRLKPCLYGTVAARLAGCSRIATLFTGLGHYFAEPDSLKRFPGLVLAKALAAVIKYNVKILFQNSEDKELFLKAGLGAPGKTAVVPGSGVNTEYFQPRAAAAGPHRFLLATRLLREKGILEFCEAARIVKGRYPDTKYVILGGQSTEPSRLTPGELQPWIVDGTIDFKGEVGDVRQYLADAAVVVLPSYYREGIPRSLLEGLAMGKPIITTDTPGCRETVVEGWNGWLVRPRDAVALADAMTSSIESADNLRVMGQRSRKLALDRFEVSKVVAQMSFELGLTNLQGASGIERIYT